MRLRLYFSDNPLGLHLGELVKVKRSCEIEYDADGNKGIVYKRTHPFTAFVVGSVLRATGKYIPGRTFSSFLGEDDEPPRLKVDKYVRLYEVKVFMGDKPILVHPDDIEVLT